MKNWIKRILIGCGLIALIGFLLIRFVLMPAEFRAQANPAPDCNMNAFDKSALVFDTLLICGTNEVSAEKLTYAANVAAEWLDNDEDGQVDEPRLLEAMKENEPMVLMSAGGIPMMAIPKMLPLVFSRTTQDLGAAETNPDNGRRDASQEEIHHIIMNSGWQFLDANIFSDQEGDNSTLYQAWKFAEDNAHYAYDDPTCNDSCKVVEFVYLATAAYLGSDADLESDEMRLKSRDALAEAIPAMIEIFESPDYIYPMNHWPDGSYDHSTNIKLTISN